MNPKNLLKRENYEWFIEGIAKAVFKYAPDACFYLYGSNSNGRAVYGVSDIDGGIILNSNFVTPINQIDAISEEFRRVYHKEKEIPFHINLLDLGTIRDGRFLYTRDYTEHILRKGKVICGPNYLADLKGFEFKSGVLYALSQNLRRMKNNLLTCALDLENQEDLQEKVIDSITKIASLPKKFLYLLGEEIIEDKNEAFCEFKRRFPKENLGFLEKAICLSSSSEMLYRNLASETEAIALYQNSTTAFESMVKAYLIKYPELKSREVKH